MTHGFHVAMLACAILALAGGALAWLTIDSKVLERRTAPPEEELGFSCGIAGPPWGEPSERETPARSAART